MLYSCSGQTWKTSKVGNATCTEEMTIDEDIEAGSHIEAARTFYANHGLVPAYIRDGSGECYDAERCVRCGTIDDFDEFAFVQAEGDEHDIFCPACLPAGLESRRKD